jgi:hypothetical protein
MTFFEERCRAARARLHCSTSQAAPPVVEEGCPALEDIIDGPGEVVAAGELGALFAHVDRKRIDKRLALLPANCPALQRILAVDRSLDLEQASMWRTTSTTRGERAIAFLPAACRRAFS